MATKLQELKQSLAARGNYAKDRHKEAKELANLKFKHATEILSKKDQMAKSRHQEKLELYGEKS
jgi:hypothetical protein